MNEPRACIAKARTCLTAAITDKNPKGTIVHYGSFRNIDVALAAPVA
jgi:hypothetical protein